MPKKTKKQKILAQLHRKIASVSSPPSQLVKRQNISNQSTSTIPSSFAFEYKNVSVTKPKINIAPANYGYITHDLIRITIFSVAAIIFQGVLYFLLYRR